MPEDSFEKTQPRSVILRKEATKMGLYRYFDERAKTLGIVDLKLVQGGMIFFTLIIVKVFPRIMNIDIWWFVALFVLFIARPIYVFFFKK